jgi:outer membrane receptor protein involved in Fe transport
MEVLKGAGTSLYGSGAVAATVNIVSADIADSPQTRIDLILGEDEYTIGNLKARYQLSDQFSFNARVLNLTDEEYVQEASYRYGTTPYSPGAPRTAYTNSKNFFPLSEI